MPSPKLHNKPMSNPHVPSPRHPVGAPAQEAVGLHPRPDPLADARSHAPRKKTRSAVSGVEADARGQAPRKKTRSAIPGVEADARSHAPRKKTRSAVSGVEADARGNPPRKKTRSAVSGVEADARGQAPRKKTRPVGRGGRSRGRRPRRRSLALAANAGPSLPRLSSGSHGIDGEIALLRSLTNRLLSKRPLDHVQISRYLRILVRAISADSRMPRELTDQEQIDSLIRKVFHKSVNDGELNFYDLVPVRMARPGDKWWPWRELLPLEFRWRHGIIDPEERWPHEENEYLAEMEAMDRAMAESYLDEDPDDDDPDEDPDDDECPPSLTVIPAEAGTHPREESHMQSKILQADHPPQQDAPRREAIPRAEAAPDPPPARRTARARPP